MSDSMPRTVLIVDDDVLMSLELSHLLTEFGFAVLGQARNVADVRKLLRVRLPAAAIIGARLADDENGVPLARDLQASDVRVVLTGSDPVDGWTGPFLRKPFGARRAADLLAVRNESPDGRTWLRGLMSE
jgi:DNA-binding NtrC family response regulator